MGKRIGEFPEKNPPTPLAYLKIICPLPRNALRSLLLLRIKAEVRV